MTSQNIELSRRRLLQTVGIGAGAVAATGVLGACQAEGAEGDGSGGKFVYVYPFDTTTQHHNAAISNAALLVAAPVAELFLPRPAIMNWDTSEWIHQLAESSSLEGETLTVKLRGGIKWTDGADLTAADLVGSIYLQKLNAAQGTIGWDQLVSATADDDLTVTVTYSETFPGVEHGVLKTQVLPHARYGDWMDQAAELVAAGVVQGDPEQSALSEQIAAEDFLDDGFPITCGAYKFKEIGETVVTFEVHQDGLFADQVKFDTVQVQKGDNAASVQMILNQEVDYSTQVLGATDRETIAGVEGLKEISTPGYDGIGLMLNQGRFPEFADVRVRKAFMYIFDTEVIGEIAKGAGGYYVPSTYTGLPDPHAEGLFDDVELEYYASDHAKAAELLEEAGWTLEDDGWHTPEGDLAEYEIVGVDGWTDFALTGEQATSQLNEFGFNITYRNLPDDGNQWGAWGAGDFDIAVRQWANPFVPYVYGSWQMAWFTDNANTTDAPGMGIPTDAVETEALGTVDLDELYLKSQKGTEEEQTEANKQLGIVFNETLPRLPLFLNQRVSYAVEGVRVKEVDSGDYELNDVYFDNPVMVRILEGEIEPA